LVEDKLRKHLPEKKATYHKEKRKEGLKRQPSQNEIGELSDDEKHQTRKEDARNIIAQARVNNARYAWKEENYEDNEKEMGALCFTLRVHRTRVPKGFKLPHDQQKYDGSQEPMLWLSDYMRVVQILGGTRATAMQCLQLHLTGAARSWLNTLPNDSIGSWGELEPIRKKFSLNIQMPSVTGRTQVVRVEKRRTSVLLYTMLECNQKLCRRRLRRESIRCFFGWPSSFGPRGRGRENKAEDSVGVNGSSQQICRWRGRI
jgi:hypothetical protein